MTSRRRASWLVAFLAILLLIAFVAAPYARSALLFARIANIGGRVEAFAEDRAGEITVDPIHMVQTRQGDVRAQIYRPGGTIRRALLLVPGVHSMGIIEPRLVSLARDLAGTGVLVMAMALPDLQNYGVTARSADTIEDALAWMAAKPELAAGDGRIGLVGISFAGGLSIVAAGRESIRDKVAFVLSFGGHGDLQRTLRYLATGVAPQAEGLITRPPHDYGVAVILHAGADRVAPAEQVEPLREGIRIFLLASQLTLVDRTQADAMFQKARDYAKTLPEPAATLMTYVNDRNTKALGPILTPHITLQADPAASPDKAPLPPAAPVFLIHGDDDIVIPAAESVLLAEYLRSKGVEVRLLLSPIITHAEFDKAAAYLEVWKLISFWADVLQQ
jgi:dienelactone hydrolase